MRNFKLVAMALVFASILSFVVTYTPAQINTGGKKAVLASCKAVNDASLRISAWRQTVHKIIKKNCHGKDLSKDDAGNCLADIVVYGMLGDIWEELNDIKRHQKCREV